MGSIVARAHTITFYKPPEADGAESKVIIFNGDMCVRQFNRLAFTLVWRTQYRTYSVDSRVTFAEQRI